jgi:hypothetical protein
MLAVSGIDRYIVNLRREEPRLLDRGVGRRLDDREHHALILRGRELTLREHEERNGQQSDDRPQHQDDRPVAKRSGERPRVPVAHVLEAAVNPAGEAAIRRTRAQERRGHHR